MQDSTISLQKLVQIVVLKYEISKNVYLKRLQSLMKFKYDVIQFLCLSVQISKLLKYYQ